MGRKSQKAKEKKQKRKEENAMLSTKLTVVKAANEIDDPMNVLASAFRKFDRNGINVNIDCCRATSLDEGTKEWIFEVVKENMRMMYELSEWGWDDKDKRAELLHDSAYYLIARQSVNNQPVACVHFRFDIDFGDAVLYCYEIQLTPEVRRKGLGKFLMQILELLANKYNMEKLMLSVFKQNDSAYDFFVSKLKFEVDETNLAIDPRSEVFYDPDLTYTFCILSKPTGPRKQQLIAAKS